MESIFLSSKHHNQQPNKYLVNHCFSFLSQGDLDKLRDGVVFLTVHDVGASYEVESLASIAKVCFAQCSTSRLALGSPGWLVGCHHAQNSIYANIYRF